MSQEGLRFLVPDIAVSYNRNSLHTMLYNWVLCRVLRQVLFNMLCLTFALPGCPSHASNDTLVPLCGYAPTNLGQ